MIFCIAGQAGSGWKKLLSCRQTRTLPHSWFESRLSETDLLLYEYRAGAAADQARDLAFLLGYIWRGADEDRTAGSPFIILHASQMKQEIVLHNPVNLPSYSYYPDIILGHDFSEQPWPIKPDTFLHGAYANLIPLFAPHQILGFSINIELEKKRLYPIINSLKNYVAALDNLLLEDRRLPV